MTQNEASRVTGMLTLDVEDWEHANYAELASRKAEILHAVRHRQYAMDANVDRWIEVLGRHGAKSTCFVLGEFAQRYPLAIRRLTQAGHEIACHGYTHDLVYEMTRERFREELRRGLGVLGELTGKAPVGYRAASWSVDHRTPWFIEELAAQGVRYDSSEFPVKTPLFGNPGGELTPRREGGILRVPVTVLTLGPLRLPFSSGAFFRLAPLALIRYGLGRAARKGHPVMVVLHPRELDADHPRLPLKGWVRAVHYARLGSVVPKLEAVLRSFEWTSILDRVDSGALEPTR